MKRGRRSCYKKEKFPIQGLGLHKKLLRDSRRQTHVSPQTSTVELISKLSRETHVFWYSVHCPKVRSRHYISLFHNYQKLVISVLKYGFRDQWSKRNFKLRPCQHKTVPLSIFALFRERPQFKYRKTVPYNNYWEMKVALLPCFLTLGQSLTSAQAYDQLQDTYDARDNCNGEEFCVSVYGYAGDGQLVDVMRDVYYNKRY